MRTYVLCLLLVCSLLPLAGCGNVSLKGEALTAAEVSTLDAHQAVLRTQADESAPLWTRAYLVENFRQWRFFVRSARKDLTWGPKLEGE